MEIDKHRALRFAHSFRVDAEKYAPETLHLFDILKTPQDFMDRIVLITAREHSEMTSLIVPEDATEEDLNRLSMEAPEVFEWLQTLKSSYGMK